MLKTGEADLLASPSVRKAVAGDVVWTVSPATVQGRIAVASAGHPELSVRINIKRQMPWSWSVLLLHEEGKANLRRLDLRQTHRNTRTDHAAFLRRSHLHRWSAENDDAHAVAPDFQWWDDDLEAVPCDEYRAVVTAFCEHVGIDSSGLTWSLPPEVDCHAREEAEHEPVQ